MAHNMTPTADQELRTGLYWKGKTTEFPRASLPFQTIETINNCYTNSGGNGKLEHSNRKDDWHNRLIWGDKNYILPSLLPEIAGKVNLIYIDPPFFSNRNYEIIWGDEAEIRSFDDRWEGGINVYIDWMKERIIELHRVLRPTGSFYLHCDWHAGHSLKLACDEVFGLGNLPQVVLMLILIQT